MSGSSLAQPLACTPSGLTALQQGASDAVNSRGSYAWPALEVSDSNPWTRLQRRTRTPVDYVIGIPGFACVENRTEPEISPKVLKTLMPGEPSCLLNGFLMAGARHKERTFRYLLMGAELVRHCDGRHAVNLCLGWQLDVGLRGQAARAL